MILMSMSALESYVLILMNTMAISTQVVITVIMKCPAVHKIHEYHTQIKLEFEYIGLMVSLSLSL